MYNFIETKRFFNIVVVSSYFLLWKTMACKNKEIRELYFIYKANENYLY